jgi:hypothetical protein
MHDDLVGESVKATLRQLAKLAPGKAIEVRVPPYAAIQCGDGPTHTRGTPPNTIEMNAQTWLALAEGTLSWREALISGEVRAFGVRADLSAFLPLSIEKIG